MEVEIGGQRGEGRVGVRGRPESGDSSSGPGHPGEMVTAGGVQTLAGRARWQFQGFGHMDSGACETAVRQFSQQVRIWGSG